MTRVLLLPAPLARRFARDPSPLRLDISAADLPGPRAPAWTPGLLRSLPQPNRGTLRHGTDI